MSPPQPLPAPDSPDLVERVRAGDARAFEALFRAHYPSLCGFVARYVRDRAVAEELVQDLFTALWARRAQWVVRGGSGSVRPYLFSAARNRALNLRARQAVERDWERDEAIADVRALHPAPRRADEVVEEAELRRRVATAIESLPERCRLVMQLRWREQLSYAEIAEVMGYLDQGGGEPALAGPEGAPRAPGRGPRRREPTAVSARANCRGAEARSPHVGFPAPRQSHLPATSPSIR